MKIKYDLDIRIDYEGRYLEGTIYTKNKKITHDDLLKIVTNKQFKTEVKEILTKYILKK